MVSGAKKLSYLMAMVITGAMMIMPVAQAADTEDEDLYISLVEYRFPVKNRPG
jgi:hypothetical protein